MDLVDVRQLEWQVADLLARLDPDEVPLPEAMAMYQSLARIEKLAGGGKLRMARKVEEAGTASQQGERSAADLLAKANGTSKRQAQDELDTSKRLREQRDTERALTNGDLSTEQATTISDAAEKDPTAERKLLDTAGKEGLGKLREEAAKVKANADAHPDDTRKRIHAGRSCRRFTDREGFTNLHVRGHAEDIDAVERKLAPFTKAAFEQGRAAGSRDHHVSYAYDGFMTMVGAVGQGDVEVPKGASRHDVKTFLHIDLDTWLAREKHPGSTCHIDGVGPVDLGYVDRVLDTSYLVAVLERRDGTIFDVVNLGRHATAEQRSAKEAQGICCEIPGCSCTKGLELHHVRMWSEVLRTVVDDLAWACAKHHDLVTYKGFTLTGRHGARIWADPEGRIIAQERPPPDRGGGAGTAPPEPAGQHQLFA